jgi:hypothetical protein
MATRPENPLAKLTAVADPTTRDMLRAVYRANANVRALIDRAVAEADMQRSAARRDALYRRIAATYGELARGLDEHLKTMTGKVAQQSGNIASKAAGAAVARYDAARLERYWQYVTPANSGSLAAVYTESMTDQAINALRQAFIETYRQASAEGLTANEASRELKRRWSEAAGDQASHRFIDRSGRPWENARYLQMLARTTAQRVARDSYIDRLTEMGYKLAKISDDGDADCEVCAAWEGVIVLIAGRPGMFPTWGQAKAAGVGHPNCLHTVLFVDPEADRAEIERQAKIPFPRDLDNVEAVQKRKDKIDIEGYQAKGLNEDDARHAVARDRVKRAILTGAMSDEAAGAVKKLPTETLDKLFRDGVPRFQRVKKGEFVGWRRGVRGGVVRLPRDPSAADVLRILG